MPSRNIIIAMALIVCITFRLKLVGLFGSFFLKKYIRKFNKKRGLSVYRKALWHKVFYTVDLFLFELNTTV